MSGPAALEPTAEEWHAAAANAIQETADKFAEFTVEDLRTADRVVLTNALRGPLVARVEDLA